MVRHFKTRQQAVTFRFKEAENYLNVFVAKKIEGMKNRFKKPYVVCNLQQWEELK